jgi:hypothetical protein
MSDTESSEKAPLPWSSANQATSKPRASRRSGRVFRQSVQREYTGDPQGFRKTGQTAWRLLSPWRHNLAWSTRPVRGYYTTRRSKACGRKRAEFSRGIHCLSSACPSLKIGAVSLPTTASTGDQRRLASSAVKRHCRLDWDLAFYRSRKRRSCPTACCKYRGPHALWHG